MQGIYLEALSGHRIHCMPSRAPVGAWTPPLMGFYFSLCFLLSVPPDSGVQDYRLLFMQAAYASRLANKFSSARSL